MWSNRSSKSVMFYGSVRPGRVRFVRKTGETFLSHRLGHAKHIPGSKSSIHPPRRSTASCPRGWFAGLNCMSARSHIHRCLTMSQLNFRPSSLRPTRGCRKLSINTRCHATQSALLLGIGNAKGNFDAFSIASKICALPGKEVAPIRSKSTFTTPPGSTARAGRRASC